MKTVYAIRDRIANELVGMTMYVLFVFRTDAQAVRYFADAVNDPKSILAKHPADYELIALGALVETSAGEELSADEKPRVIITGDALIAAQAPNDDKVVKLA